VITYVGIIFEEIVAYLLRVVVARGVEHEQH
jgi:hypothetical protein